MNSKTQQRNELLHCAAVAAGLALLLATQIATAWALSGLLIN